MKKLINILLLVVAIFIVSYFYTHFIKPNNQETIPNNSSNTTSNSTNQNSDNLLGQLANSLKNGSVDTIGEQLVQKIGNSDPKKLLNLFNAIPEDKREQVINYFASHLNSAKDTVIIGVFQNLKSDPNTSQEEKLILSKILTAYKNNPQK